VNVCGVGELKIIRFSRKWFLPFVVEGVPVSAAPVEDISLGTY
jgi:hypothetical protein